jgi:hypothetical protein
MQAIGGAADFEMKIRQAVVGDFEGPPRGFWNEAQRVYEARI